jgi:hypothetical protein
MNKNIYHNYGYKKVKEPPVGSVQQPESVKRENKQEAIG